MKTIFTLTSILFFSIISVAGFGQRLSITSMSRTPIRVTVDGRDVQDYNNEIRVGNLNAGLHRIQIYVTDNRYNDNNNNRGWGRDKNNRYGRLIYNTTLSMRQGMHTDIIVNRFGRVFVDEQNIDDRNDDNWNNTGGWNDRNNNGGWNNTNRYGMNDAMFQQLKQQVKSESFDNKRLDFLRTVLPNNTVSSMQVKELAQIFDFERNKLDLAKYAYRYTTDRGNYFVVNDVFDFGNSKTELSQFIASYRD